MNKNTTKISLVVAIFITVLLSEVEPFLKIGRGLNRSPQQDLFAESSRKYKGSVLLQEEGLQLEPSSLTRAARKRIKLLQPLERRYNEERNDLKRTVTKRKRQM